MFFCCMALVQESSGACLSALVVSVVLGCVAGAGRSAFALS